MNFHASITKEKILFPSTSSTCHTDMNSAVDSALKLPQTCGARVVFTGCVRNHDQNQQVNSLVYEAHPQAEDFLVAAVQSAIAGLEIENVYVAHRIGHLEIGDIALLVVVDSAHRAEAFLATSKIVDEIKAKVPIWKNQFFADGTSAWSNCP